MAPSMPGFVLTWAPVPTGRAPHTRVAPCRSQLSRAEEIGGLLRPVVAPPSGARHVLPSSTRAFQPWGHFQPPFILPGRRQNLPEGEPSALCRFRYTRARGRGQQLGALQGQPPAGGPMEAPLQSARPKERPPGRERQLRRHGPRPPERGGGHSRRHAGGLHPCTQSASPSVGLAVVRSGAFSSAWASSRGDVLRGGWSATGARPFLARTSLDHRAESAAHWLSSP